MKLTIFQSEKGDCLLLSSGTKAKPVHVLVDGGMAASYRAHAAETLSALPQLDLVYVSHIDEDHISGVLQMIDDAFAWRVFRFREKKGVAHPEPDFPEPPPIKRIWHNAFHDQVEKNDEPLEDLVIATAAIVAGSDALRDDAVALQDIATSIPQAIQLSQRISSKQLKIKHNENAGKLLKADGGKGTVKIGTIKFTIIGPFEDELIALREQWNEFLTAAKNQARLRKLRAQAAADARGIAASSLDDVMVQLEARAGELGKRENVTVPNLASLMVLVEEDGHTLLLTGDGHQDTVLEGLRRKKKLNADGRLHVNVLKVQHHGSEHNIDANFCEHITADHYVFCGDGAHHNPDLRVIELIADSRIGANRSANAEAGDPFTFWFNCHSSVAKPRNRAHMKEIEATVARLKKKSGGQMSAEFLRNSAFPPLTV